MAYNGKKLLSVLCLLIFAVCFVQAMDWPAPGSSLTRNFGWNDQGKPVLGCVFQGDDPIAASEKGEIIFSHSGNESASRLPSPLGAWTAVDHGDGLLCIYSRYQDGTARPSGTVEKGEPVAEAGMSGWTANKGFYFVVYDRKERRWVNPSMVISPFPDTRPPVIMQVELRDPRGTPVPSWQLQNLSQGRYTIVVSAQDTMINPIERPLAPHRIILSINGTETSSVNMETITARDGILLTNRGGLFPARQVYAPFPAFEAGDALLSRGQATLEVIVQDIAGNSRSAILRMRVE